MPMAETVLEFKNVTWRYEGTPKKGRNALEDVSLSVKKGEYVGIIGANDAGKSTLCRLCNGLIPNSFNGDLSGDVFVNGRNIKDIPTAQLAGEVGSVFADPEAQLSQISVFDELAFGPSNLEVPREEIIKRVEETMDIMGIRAFRDRSPFSLSGGEQQKVAIASVMTMTPEILVLDEPTSNLDPIGTESVFMIIDELNKKEGMTIILVEHEIELMAQFVDRFIVLDEGQVILDGTPEEVFSHRDVFEKIGIFVPTVTEIASIADKKYGSWDGSKYPITLDEMLDKIDERL